MIKKLIKKERSNIFKMWFCILGWILDIIAWIFIVFAYLSVKSDKKFIEMSIKNEKVKN